VWADRQSYTKGARSKAARIFLAERTASSLGLFYRIFLDLCHYNWSHRTDTAALQDGMFLVQIQGVSPCICTRNIPSCKTTWKGRDEPMAKE
jgi:hypothetical protein